MNDGASGSGRGAKFPVVTAAGEVQVVPVQVTQLVLWVDPLPFTPDLVVVSRLVSLQI